MLSLNFDFSKMKIKGNLGGLNILRKILKMNEESGKGVWAVAGKRVKSAIKQTEQWHELRECAKAFVIWKIRKS